MALEPAMHRLGIYWAQGGSDGSKLLEFLGGSGCGHRIDIACYPRGVMVHQVVARQPL